MKYLFFCLPLFLSACGDGATTSAETEKASDAPTAKPAPVKPVFDVPSLMFSDAASLKKTLGKPESEDHLTPLQIRAGVNSDIVFIKDSTTLMVTYDSHSHKTVELFLSFEHSTADVAALLAAGNLQADRLRYQIKPVREIKNPSLYTGITIVPQRHIMPQ